MSFVTKMQDKIIRDSERKLREAERTARQTGRTLSDKYYEDRERLEKLKESTNRLRCEQEERRGW